MRLAPVLALASALAAACPAAADWRAANAQVEAAARDPDIAAVLAQTVRMDAAILARDTETFAGLFAADAVVNSPFNNVARPAEARARSASGLLHYRSLSRVIEYAARRANGEVVLMGEETYVPRSPHPLADKTVRRRTTELWVPTPDGWRLAIRQATNFDAR
jgi:ketosteroid isomerase-like protein